MRWITRSLFMGLSTLLCVACGRQSPPTFTLSSGDVAANGVLTNQQVLNGFGCTGLNMSPELHWSNQPVGTKSYALTLYDPDAPTGSGWWHWVVYNLPTASTTLPAGAGDPTHALLPVGTIQGTTDFGQPGYGGPCPPTGDAAHHYLFTIYALDIERLDVPPTATAALIGFNIHGHTLAKATLTTTYGR